jgi:predicted GNAT family acetyltransferase
MHVTRHSDPDAFLVAAAPMAARGQASASFFIGWAHAMKRTPPSAGERVYLATVRDGATCGVAIRRDDGPVIIGQSDATAAIAFADDLAQEEPGLQGVVGALPAAEAFAGRWRELTGRTRRLRVRLRQHALAVVNEVPAAPGAPRTATEADIEWLIEGQCAFVAEVGVPDPPERVRALLPKRVLRGEYRIWDHDGRVAFAGFSDAAPDFARIAPVYTPPECRGRGYATSLVARMSSELLARGKQRLFLTTDIANPTSNAIYARIGFRAENDDWHFDFVSPEP